MPTFENLDRFLESGPDGKTSITPVAPHSQPPTEYAPPRTGTHRAHHEDESLLRPMPVNVERVDAKVMEAEYRRKLREEEQHLTRRERLRAHPLAQAIRAWWEARQAAKASGAHPEEAEDKEKREPRSKGRLSPGERSRERGKSERREKKAGDRERGSSREDHRRKPGPGTRKGQPKPDPRGRLLDKSEKKDGPPPRSRPDERGAERPRARLAPQAELRTERPLSTPEKAAEPVAERPAPVARPAAAAPEPEATARQSEAESPVRKKRRNRGRPPEQRPPT